MKPPAERLPGKWRWEWQTDGWVAVWRLGKSRATMLRPRDGETFREACTRNHVSEAAWKSWGGK